MGTNLLYESFPGNYSTRDLNMEAVGSRCLPCKDDKTLKSELHYNGVLPPPALPRQLGSDKEELRQTILKQEVMFNDQVQELHRLYRRQMELMNEIEKKQLHKQSDYAVKMSQEPRDLDSISTRPNSLIDLNQPYQGEEAGTSTSVYSLDPGINQGEIPGRDPSAKTNSGFGVSSMESFGNSETKKNVDACSRPQEHPPFTNEAGHNRSTLVDFQFPSVSTRGRPRHHLERSPIVVLALPAFNGPAPLNKFSRRSIARPRHTGNKLHVGRSSRCSPQHGHVRSKITSHDSHFESMTSSTDHDFSPGHPAHKEHLKGSDIMDVKSERDMDLNSIPPARSADVVSQQQICTMDKGDKSEESWPALSVPGASVVAPISPENQECPRPRGESEETPLDLSQGKGTGPLEKPDKIAAEESLFTSSTGIEACLESAACDPSNTSPLYWFVTICLDPDTESKLAFSGNNGAEQEGLSCDEVDYFEAMTLKLVELKSEEHLCKNNSQKEEGTCSTIFLSQPKKGRRWRRQKDFQKEILPSLASLARHEVAEDLQTIGGLVKAAGSPPGTKLARDAGKNKEARGRKRMRASVSNVVESTGSMPLQQPAATAEPGSQDRWLTGWGSVRRRGQRHRTSNPSLLLTQFS
ncbi:uncharacterized protein LOC100853516 [Vitis vinifera]|eukprot:XP_010663324.1 PREDICTED: uncharacterized protein LOC100853516 isoform X1 [Vitis vinifera]